MNQYVGRTVIITGASSGIGRALAIEAAVQGARVGITARRADKLLELVAEIQAKGGSIAAEIADVSDRDSLRAAITRLESVLGPCDVMIANAGVGFPSGADPVNVVGVETMMRVNYLGVVHAFESVLPAMIARGSGHLVAISSLAAYKGMPTAAGYSASKAAVNTYCEALRIELRSRGVAVTAVCPGFIRTAMTARNKHPMPFLMDADIAARRILSALRRRPKTYNFPWQLYRMMRITRWLPDWFVARLATRPTFPE